MDCIQTKRIEVVIRNPFQRIGNEKVPDLIAVSIIKVQVRSPRRLVPICKIWRKLREIISLGADMVVYDVEDRCEAALVARIYKPLECDGTAVRILNGKWKDTVVTPITCTGKLCDRHDFHSGNSAVN